MKTGIGIRASFHPSVRFKLIPLEFLDVLRIVFEEYLKQNCIVVITGASYETYEDGGYHDQGYAWDFRTKSLPNPLLAIGAIYYRLRKLSKHYRVLYHDTGNGLHLHIEYRIDGDPCPEGY